MSEIGRGGGIVEGTGRAWLLALVLALGVAGCAGSGNTRPDPFYGAGGSQEGLVIAVLNNNAAEVRVYLVSDARREMLGSLIPQEVEVFEVPWSGVRQLRVELEQAAGEQYRTPFVTVRAGTRVDIVIQRDIRRTRIRKR